MVLHRFSLFSAALLCANLWCPCCLAVLRFGFRGSMLTSPMQLHSTCSNYFPPGREGDLPEKRDVFDSLAEVCTFRQLKRFHSPRIRLLQYSNCYV